MRILSIFLLALACNLQAQQVEIYADWLHDAKEEDLFAKGSIFSQIKEELVKQGADLASWDRERHRPSLLKWSRISDWGEFGDCLYAKKPNPEGLWVFWNLGTKMVDFDLSKINREKMVLFLWEPPTTQPALYEKKTLKCFSKVFTWDDDLVDNVKFFKFYYPQLREKIGNIPCYHKKKLCTLINSRLSSKHPKQLYSERETAIRFFEDKGDDFDLYGRYWEKRNYKNYKGTVADKLGVMKNYRFCICYENMRDVKGYITEKIFDCFAAGVVPIYWGASNVADYIPKGCFIDRRDFESMDELYAFMKSMDQKEYLKYIHSAENYLKSEEAKLFSEENFIQTFVKGVTAQNPSS